MRQIITFNQPLEKEIGFCRAVRVGNTITVAGTAPIAKDGSPESPGDAYKQTCRCFEIIQDVIERAGGNLKDVVRTRIFLKNINDWKDAAKAHGEYFSTIQPVTTFVEVSNFINPLWLVEIEADCIIAGE